MWLDFREESYYVIINNDWNPEKKQGGRKFFVYNIDFEDVTYSIPDADYHQLRHKYNREQGKLMDIVNSTGNYISFSTSAPVFDWDTPCPTIKENNMGYYNDAQLTIADGTTDQRRHLIDRINDIWYKKQEEIRKTYHLSQDTPPTTKDDLLDRLATGKFKLNPNYFNEKGQLNNWSSALAAIEWRTVDADKEGFDKATEALRAANTKAMDDASILAPEAGLASLREFEAMTF